MQLGPFDSRKKQSRCLACSASHLKCAGDVPCTNCTRRRVACSYAEKNSEKTQIISLDKGQTWTPKEWPYRAKHQPAGPRRAVATVPDRQAGDGRRLSPPGHLAVESTRYLYFFDTFVQRNSFTGRTKTVGEDVKQLAGLHSRQGSHLMKAMLALGALYATRLKSTDAPPPRDAKMIALQHYSHSISGLREAIEQHDNGKTNKKKQQRRQEQLMCILWTTLFLGLFELMNDATGHGWQQHIIHGTSHALQASGPSTCYSGPGMAFFTQAKLFEVCRTILFNEPTFLTGPEWVDLSRDLHRKQQQPDVKNAWSPLDSLLDIMVMCSSLRVRAAAFIDGQNAHLDATTTQGAATIASDGHTLREALNSWGQAYSPFHNSLVQGRDANSSSLSDLKPSLNSREECRDPSMLLAQVFFAAISVYLSGVFDYELSHWQRLNLVVPTLDEATIQRHVSDIMRLADLALKHIQLSPLVFLFPLRIAGARSYSQHQRDAVLALVARIGASFAVASAISEDLNDFWERFSFSPPHHQPTHDTQP